jgi:phosphoribosylglycinamide formyltransferase-1
MMHNLLVDLSDERFGERALAAALAGIEAAGFAPGESDFEDGHLLAFIDDAFGGSWSSEAFAGRSMVARRAREIAGFATYDPKGLRFRWLRAWSDRPDVGIFGPFGVAKRFRKFGLGPHLLVAALARLRRCGYAHALVPAVGDEKLVAYYLEHSGARVVESIPKASLLASRARAVVMASGNGSNFQAVLERSRDGRLPIDVAALICNHADAYVLERARIAGIPARVVAWDRNAEKRSTYDLRLRKAVEDEEPELLLLLGWMHLLDSAFVARFPEAINIHPAYLPLDQSRDVVTLPDGSSQKAYRGAHAVRDALADGASWIGATAHRVSAATDRGEVLARKPLAVVPDSAIGDSMATLHSLEQDTVSVAITRWCYERTV